MLLWIIYPIVEALVQAYLQIYKNWKPVYLQLNLVRGIVAILFGIFVLNMPYDMKLFFSFVGFAMSSFFIVFDPLLNKLKKKPFGYTGKRSGWINAIIGDNKKLYIAFYCFCVLLAIVSFKVYYS